MAARALPTAAVSATVVTVAEPGGTDPDRDIPHPLDLKDPFSDHQACSLGSGQ